MDLTKDVEEVLKKLESAGFESYVVGGAVRNYLLGIGINDYDIASNALPEEITRLFKGYKVIDIGKQFGTIKVFYKDSQIEITTFRSDGRYINGRSPEGVYFSNSLEEDLERRDFTINAMAYNRSRGIVDLFDGRNDLKNALVRTVGNPDDRFREDYLRILRGIRFATCLDLELEATTKKAARKYIGGIKYISKERIRDEIFKILMADKPSRGIELLREVGGLEIILPTLNEAVGFNQDSPYHSMDLYNHTLEVLDGSEKDLEIRLAALFHDLGKLYTKSIDEEGVGHFYGHHKVSLSIAQKFLEEYNSPRELINKVGLLIDSHMINNKDFGRKGIKRLINKHGEIGVFKLMSLQKADRRATSDKGRDISDIVSMEDEIRDILNSQEVYDEKQLAINGNDVIELGYNEGKIIGEILEFVMDRVMEDSRLNNKEDIEKLIKDKFKTS